MAGKTRRYLNTPPDGVINGYSPRKLAVSMTMAGFQPSGTELARLLRKTPQAGRRKFRGEDSWKREEIQAVAVACHMSPAQMLDVFFGDVLNEDE